MLQRCSRPSPTDLAAIADLERRVIDADGGRLKVDWVDLRARSGERVDDLLWWDGPRLVGYAGLSWFDKADVELTGMVDPDARRRGVATELWTAAAQVMVEAGKRRALLVVPNVSTAGAAFARARGGVQEFAEHAMALDGAPTAAVGDPEVALRPAEPADTAAVTRLRTAGFPAQPPRPEYRTGDVLVELDGAAVGVLRVERDGDRAGIYGFTVDPARQGRGIGRAALRAACRDLRADGVTRVELEVAVDNVGALGVYTAVGFVPVAVDDYWAVPL